MQIDLTIPDNAKTHFRQRSKSNEKEILKPMPLSDAALSILRYAKSENAERVESTPRRFAKAYEHLLSGYEKDVRKIVGNALDEVLSRRGVLLLLKLHIYV